MAISENAPDIFVVDDNALVRTGIVRMLENENYVVREFDAPRKFIAELFAAQTLPRLIISDFDMEGMTGLDIISTLKSSQKHKHLPVLIVSAQSKPEIQEKAKQAGALAWIKKSAIGNDMMPAVRKYILNR